MVRRPPREATTSVALLRLPPLPDVPPPLAGRLTVAVRFASTGTADDGAQLLAPMRAVATPIVDLVATMPYAALGAIHADPVDPMPTHEGHALLSALPAEAVDRLLAVAGPGVESPQIIVELRQLGGAIADLGENSSAFSSRSAAFSLLTIGLGVPPVVEAVAPDSAAVIAALGPWATGSGLPNFAPATDRGWLERTYDAPTLARLARAARSYDPAGTIAGSELLGAAAPQLETARG